jgi:phenylalanyl-tRNA synthetase alpha chain
MKIEDLGKQAKEEITKASSKEALFEVEVKYLGRKGALTEVLRGLSGMSPEEKRKVGAGANKLKIELE